MSFLILSSLGPLLKIRIAIYPVSLVFEVLVAESDWLGK